jgi:hypothetical protein
MAIHVAASLGLPVEVRVPTTALVDQWERRLAENLVPLSPGPMPPIRVSTYASLGEFAPQALVVLDEAHHLLAKWGAAISDSLGSENRVLGLTATPPFGSRGWDQFLSLVGPDPVTVEAAPLVRDGHLCPYRDLVWPVLADPDDAPALRDAAERLKALERTYAEPLDSWVALQLRERLLELTEARFVEHEGLLVALCRKRVAEGRDLPNDLAPDPEYRVESTLQDRALVLWSWAEQSDDGVQDDVSKALRGLGFRTQGRHIRLHEDLGYKALAACSSRLQGCLDLLVIEHKARGDSLRALILTDRDTDGGPLSAREVLRGLVSRRDTDRLDPILVTGSVFWVDDDVWPRVGPRLPPLPWRVVGGHHEVDVGDWSSAERVGLATKLLTEGVTQCLVGTRHLLGEGWDCPPVNCAIDLTGIVASVTVNQVRGRALRQDPADPSKVASIWEVVALAPGVPGGERMLEKLLERHQHTFGIDDRGRIRRGRDRLDEDLVGGARHVAENLEAIRARMVARSLDPVKTAELWSVGKGYLNQKVWRVEGLDAVVARKTKLRPEKAEPPGASSVKLLRRNWRLGAASGLVVACGLALINPWVGGALACAALGMGWQSTRLDENRARVLAVYEALVEAELVHGELMWDEDRAWVQGDVDSSRHFAQAVAELLGPVRHPRYLLLEANGSVWPVPATLGADRGHADQFSRIWAREVGPCEVIFARQGRGRDLLIAAWRCGGEVAAELVEEWE